MQGLYVIIDPAHCRGRDPLWVADEALAGGCAALQLREKSMTDRALLTLARALSARCRAARVPFWLNDRIDLALLADADGVHLGQDDVDLADARTLLGGRKVGISTHDLEQARAAALAGADVIGFGPVFPTRSKENPSPCVGLAGLRDACRAVTCPVVAIGGIEHGHARELAAAGAGFAAVISAVCGADDPRRSVHALHAALLGGAEPVR